MTNTNNLAIEQLDSVVVLSPLPSPHSPSRQDSIASDISGADSDTTCRSFESGQLLLVGSSTRSLISMMDNKAANMPEAKARVVHLNNYAKNAEFCDNKVITAKYTKLNFIPTFFYARLSQVANFYFLLVGIGQLIPQISSTQGLPYQWMVLMIVLSIDAVFAALEDRERHRADAKMNARVTQIFDPTHEECFREILWQHISVGSFLKVCNYEAVPADLLLLAVAEPNRNEPVGMCFVETKSLDGETNLKIRQALSCTFSQLSDPRSLGDLPGRIICEKPHHDVNNFSGRYEPKEGHTIPLDLKNIALRGSVIRNTPYVYGLVLSTGADTKIMQSATKTPSKVSKILQIVNRCTGILMTLLVLLCILGASYCSGWISSNYRKTYYLILYNLDGATSFRNDVLGWFIYLGYFWILIASFVPITLYVTIAIVKSYQTFFVNRDIKMYDEVTDTPALVRNADLNDDLGQITHIFSDKTGTLTANEMDFRKMSINGVSYGRGTTEIGREAVKRLGKDISVSDVLADSTPFNSPISNVHFIDPTNSFAHDTNTRTNPEQAKRIHDFFLHLGISHSVVLEQNDKKLSKPTFSASSPDELALVSGSSFFGYTFVGRKNGAVRLQLPDNQQVIYDMLEMIDFTSTRKRMSVFVRSPEKEIFLLTKGADSVIFPRLDAHKINLCIRDITIQHLEKYASEGLRTLVIARKKVSEEQFLSWSKEYKAALSDLDQVARQKAGEPNRIEDLEELIEKDLELLGATAIEDRLQDHVTSTIADLSKSGIKIWILTGDKEETAINIGFACQLLNNDMHRLIINADAFPTVEKLYDLLLSRTKDLRRIRKEGATHYYTSGQAIIIDGNSLTMVFDHTVLRDLFLEVSQQCRAVICCRVSPKQKALVVRLYKTSIQGCRSLAIGDGANDVGMIQEAHVGVGISGHEGMQAVNASDFAIAQFRFLKRLLLVHGHWNYRRMAKLAVYVVYKNIILYTTAFVIGILPGGSGTLYFNNMWMNGYNIFWTSLPIAVIGILEQESPDFIAEMFPGLYYGGAQGDLFSVRIFMNWIIQAIYEGTVCALVPLYLVGSVDSHGYSYALDTCGGIAYSCVIIVGWAKLALNTVTWNYFTAFAFLFSFLFWYVSAFLISNYFPTSISDITFPYAFTMIEFYLSILLSIMLCLGRDFLYKAYKREFCPEYYHILQEYHQYKLDAKKAQWNPPDLRYAFFKADLTQEKPRTTTTELEIKVAEKALPSPNETLSPSFASPAADTPVVQTVVEETMQPLRPVAPAIGLEMEPYTGFAYSTQILDDRFVNPLRDLVLSVKNAGAQSQKQKQKAGGESEKGFEERVKELPLEYQVIYEIQRFQIFAGWGNSYPGHLFNTDPPRFTNADFTDGTSSFGLTDWVVDPSFGGTEQWQYATKFKDFVRAQLSGKALPKKEKRRLRRRLNKLVGRSVRRRRWVPKERVVEQLIAHESP